MPKITSIVTLDKRASLRLLESYVVLIKDMTNIDDKVIKIYRALINRNVIAVAITAYNMYIKGNSEPTNSMGEHSYDIITELFKLESMSMLSDKMIMIAKAYNIDYEEAIVKDRLENSVNRILDNKIEIDEDVSEDEEDIEESEENIEESEENIEEKKSSVKDIDGVEGYNPVIHGPFKSSIEKLLLSVWEDMFQKAVDGQEVVDGFIVPAGVYDVDGILMCNGDSNIKFDKTAAVIYEEFRGACIDSGIPIAQEVLSDGDIAKPYTYNPVLQNTIASGRANLNAYKQGWKEYSKELLKRVEKQIMKLAVIKRDTGSDDVIHKVLSGYTIAIMVVGQKDNLGRKLRISCGNTSATKTFAEMFTNRLKKREKSTRSIEVGRMIIDDYIVSKNKTTVTIGMYEDEVGYQAIPQFTGELLYNMSDGSFRPSLNNMILGVDQDNNIVTAPLQKWLLPIIAGSRSGKGVLTLNILQNVIGIGTPLFYLDSKPDMAAMLWRLQEKHGIEKSFVYDGSGYMGAAPIDGRKYRAPYADRLERSFSLPTAHSVMKENYSAIIYMKAMLVIMLALEYYNEVMGGCYGDIFVVFDEMYVAFIGKVDTLINNAKLHKSANKEDKDEANNMEKILNWIDRLCADYKGSDKGTFGRGIKAVALTQTAQVGEYNSKSTYVKDLCTDMLLKREPKLFGRQEGGGGNYGLSDSGGDGRSRNFELLNNYRYFGIGGNQWTNYRDLKVFKPLLVLNENDSAEYKRHLINNGERVENIARSNADIDTDGAFVKQMVAFIEPYVNVELFRNKYFNDDMRLSGSIGFEGALAEVGRLLGIDWKEALGKSLTRSYEIADKALRHYKIIGMPDINCVEDFICSMNIEYLMTRGEIVLRAIEKTTDNNEEDWDSGVAVGFSDSSAGTKDKILPDIDDDDDWGYDKSDEIRLDEYARIDEAGGNDEDDADYISNIETSIDKFEKGNIRDTTVEESIFDVVNMEGHKRYEDIENLEDILNKSEGGKYSTDKIKPDVAYYYGSSSYTKKGKKIEVDPSKTDYAYRLENGNSFEIPYRDNHVLETNAKKLFRTLGGSRYEFNNRWKIVLNGIARVMNKDLVTSVSVTEYSLRINKKEAKLGSILGGFEDVQLVDIVNFGVMAKKFENVTRIVVDSKVLECVDYETNGNIEVMFTMFKRLNEFLIMPVGSSGKQMKVTRRDIKNRSYSEVKDTIRETRVNRKMEAVGAAKRGKQESYSPGYENRVWNTTKQMSGNGWNKVAKHLTDKNPKFLRAAGLGIVTLAGMTIGMVVSGIVGAGILVRNKGK